MRYIRNKDGIWVDTAAFRQMARHFEKYGYYTEYPKGSPKWIEFWQQEMERCINGYCVSGACITGYHYFYLNYTQIKKTDKDRKVKSIGFPNFHDWDYNYYWALEIARYGITKKKLNKLKLGITIPDFALSGDKNLLVLKARRKGYSWKTASMAAAAYNFYRRSLTTIGAYESKFADETYQKAKTVISFINTHTGWAKRKLIDDNKKCIMKAGYRIKDENGIWTEKGYLSEIRGYSFKDDPDSARGDDTFLFFFEEAGLFPNLIDSYRATEDSVKDGDITVGQIILYGTSTDMERGVKDLDTMFYDPNEYDLLPIENIWDENSAARYVGFFHGTQYNKPGYMDKQGNSLVEKAIKSELAKREALKSPSSLRKRKIEHPLKPEEALLGKENSVFPVEELKAQYNRITSTQLYKKVSIGRLHYREGKVVFEEVNGVDPIFFYRQEIVDPSSAVIIYDFPKPGAPFGAYKLAYDPYAQDQGSSLAAMYVYKGPIPGDNTPSRIVARYVGRPRTAQEANRLALYLAMFYNARIMFENMHLHVINFFKQNKALHYLYQQPDNVISKAIKKSKVNRNFGIHMTKELKENGLSYLSDWVQSTVTYNDDGTDVKMYELILDPGLIEEMIFYNKDDNFDRISAMIVLMYAIEADKDKTPEKQQEIEEKYKQVEQYYKKQYVKIKR